MPGLEREYTSMEVFGQDSTGYAYRTSDQPASAEILFVSSSAKHAIDKKKHI